MCGLYKTKHPSILIESIPPREYNINRGFLFGGLYMNYMTTAEFAKKWNISQRRVSLYCKDGRIPGAEYKGNIWLIPEDAIKPLDPRKKNYGGNSDEL